MAEAGCDGLGTQLGVSVKQRTGFRFQFGFWFRYGFQFGHPAKICHIPYIPFTCYFTLCKSSVQRHWPCRIVEGTSKWSSAISIVDEKLTRSDSESLDHIMLPLFIDWVSLPLGERKLTDNSISTGKWSEWLSWNSLIETFVTQSLNFSVTKT